MVQAGATLDETTRRRRKLRNLAQSLLLLTGMVGVLSVCTALLFGWELTFWAAVGWAFALLYGPQISPRLVLNLYGARRLAPWEFPFGHQVLEALTQRASLPRTPELWYLPTAVPNAFTVGKRADAAIAVTDGLLRLLNRRELVGVLAHEIAHARNHDLWVMNLADSISRLTSLLALVGLGLLVMLLPLALFDGDVLRWLAAAGLLLLAPSLATLLQLALSRTREFDADLDAAALTGDPAGLASALEKLEHQSTGPWERLVLPGRRMPDPSILRSHPPTRERVRRLLELRKRTSRLILPAASGGELSLPVVRRSPRWRVTGLWH